MFYTVDDCIEFITEVRNNYYEFNHAFAQPELMKERMEQFDSTIFHLKNCVSESASGRNDFEKACTANLDGISQQLDELQKDNEFLKNALTNALQDTPNKVVIARKPEREPVFSLSENVNGEILIRFRGFRKNG